MKGYKVTNAQRSRTVGVACSSLSELTEKARIKFGISEGESVHMQLEDGTFVDDDNYFETLPQHTLLIILRSQENALTGSPSEFTEELGQGSEVTIFLVGKKGLPGHQEDGDIQRDIIYAGQEVMKFLSTNLKDKVQQLAHLVGSVDGDDKIFLSSKTEDPLWFQGLDTRANTKEQVMFRGAQDRIRGYMFKTCDAIKKSETYKTNKKVRAQLVETMDEMKGGLQQVKHFGSYFDRTTCKDADGSGDSLVRRLCDDAGTFRCQGKWNEDDCRYGSGLSAHFINPYCSREARVLFQMWNLDHRIERSRTVVPALLQAARLAVDEQRSVRSAYFFELLFTHHNLKLVHIVCHDKGAHSAKCDPAKFLL